MHNDNLFKWLTKEIADFDRSGYTIQYPPMLFWNKYQPEEQAKVTAAWKEALARDDGSLGLYVHIPFCRQRCLYCRYFSVALGQKCELSRYLRALADEMEIYRKIFKGRPFRTLYIGGGTPAILSVGQLEKLFSDLYSAFDLRELKQTAFEGNPDFLDQRKLRLLKKRGVNRLTIGVQSLDCKVIKAVNRYQSADSFLRCFNEAREAGIENINVDLMAGLPGQSIRSGMETLAAVLALRPEMVHIHPFFPTAGTLFMKKGGELSRADAARREKMTQMARARIKNSYLRPVKFDACGAEPSAGNLQLSDAVEKISSYLGLGAGAVSHIRGRFRYANGHNIAAYQELAGQKSLPIALIKELDEKDEMIYYLTACLRYGQVSRSSFAALFGRDPARVFKKELAYLKKRNKISISGDLIRSQMRDLYEYAVFSKYFYKPELVKKYKKPPSPARCDSLIYNKMERNKHPDVFIKSMGCALNRYRAQELAFDLAKNGLAVHNQPFGSDREFFRGNGEKTLAAGIKIWVLYACPITSFLEKLAEKFIKNIRQNYPQSAVVVSGCGFWRAPRLAKGVTIKKAEQVKAFIKERPNIRRQLGACEQIKVGAVLVKNGCGNHCAYCVCPLVNKNDQCRPLDEICEQLRDLRARGIRLIELAGPCVGDWRSDGLDFAGLLEFILKKFRFNIVNLELHPKDMHSRLIAVLAHPRISPRISVPVQSGSDCVLKRMNRKYDRAFLEKVLSELFAKKKRLILTTDIIVGSPGETEDDFEETLKLLKKFPFTRVDVYVYSAKIGPIKNNPAARKMIRRLLRDESLKKIANVTSQ